MIIHSTSFVLQLHTMCAQSCKDTQSSHRKKSTRLYNYTHHSQYCGLTRSPATPADKPAPPPLPSSVWTENKRLVWRNTFIWRHTHKQSPRSRPWVTLGPLSLCRWCFAYKWPRLLLAKFRSRMVSLQSIGLYKCSLRLWIWFLIGSSQWSKKLCLERE